MGRIATITATAWPTQGPHLGQRVEVCFHYDTSHLVLGTILRDDKDTPYEIIIQLDDGRVVRGVECQYSLLEKSRTRRRKKT